MLSILDFVGDQDFERGVVVEEKIFSSIAIFGKSESWVYKR